MERFINSERIYLRKFNENDLKNVHEMNSDPEVMEFIHNPETLEESEATLKRYMGYYDGTGLGVWSAHQIEDDKFIGMIFFKKYPNTEDIEVGYRLKRDSWEKGYATEVTKLIIDYAFEVLEIEKLFAVTNSGNRKSDKVLKKCGFIQKGKTKKYYDEELNYFEIKG